MFVMFNVLEVFLLLGDFVVEGGVHIVGKSGWGKGEGDAVWRLEEIETGSAVGEDGLEGVDDLEEVSLH